MMLPLHHHLPSKKDCYPLPLISDLLNAPQKAQVLLRVAQATQILWKSRPEIWKFGGFLESASARVLRLPSVASRVFRMEVTDRVSGMRWNRVVYQNHSEYECEGESSGGSEFV